MGVNARDGLAAAEAIWQRRARARVMAEGATLVAPETVWLSWDTVIGRDVLIEIAIMPLALALAATLIGIAWMIVG